MEPQNTPAASSEFESASKPRDLRQSEYKRKRGLAVKCEQLFRLIGGDISLFISPPSTAPNPNLHFAYFSNPNHKLGLTAAQMVSSSTPSRHIELTGYRGVSILEQLSYYQTPLNTYRRLPRRHRRYGQRLPKFGSSLLRRRFRSLIACPRRQQVEG